MFIAKFQIESLQKKCAQKTEVVLSLSKELSVTQSEVNKWKAIAENFERNLAQVEFSLQTLTKVCCYYYVHSVVKT